MPRVDDGPHPSADPGPPLPCFLLSRHWRDTRDGLLLTLWAASPRGPVRVRLRGERAVCFVERTADLDVATLAADAERRPLELRTLTGAMPVDALYFRRQRDLQDARAALRSRGIRCHESDLKPVERYLMERFVNAGFELHGDPRDGSGFLDYVDPALRACEYRPPLRQASLDIETEGLDGALYSIAVSADDDERVILVGGREVEGARVAVQTVADEAAALAALGDWLARHDPDVLLGWNVVGFDLDFLLRRAQQLGVALALGRGGERAAVLPAARRRRACPAAPCSTGSRRCARASAASRASSSSTSRRPFSGAARASTSPATASPRSAVSTARSRPGWPTTTSRTAAWCARSSTTPGCSPSCSAAPS